MIHPHTKLKFISTEIGYGVVATRFIPRGTITWALDQLDQTFTASQLVEMDDVYKQILYKYSYRDNYGDFVLCWDNSRFINHSFNANCITTAYNFELAVRDIPAGEELTDDYGYLNCIEPFQCLPEPNTLRTHVMPDDVLHHYEEWDDKIARAFYEFSKVAQPLAFLIDPVYRKKVWSVAAGIEPVDSTLHCYYSPDQQKMELKKELLKSGTHKMSRATVK
jgi:hypothetical protein